MKQGELPCDVALSAPRRVYRWPADVHQFCGSA
jgi:hypothetical protein